MPNHTSKECKSCHLPITDGQAYKLGTDQWHVPCFKCSKCSKPLGVDSNFLVLGTGALVCSDCSYTCKCCGKKIFDLAILTGDLAYCADCFKCKSCDKPIDDLKYARTSKGLFCIPCHNMLMEKKKKYEKMKKLKGRKERQESDKDPAKHVHSNSNCCTDPAGTNSGDKDNRHQEIKNEAKMGDANNHSKHGCCSVADGTHSHNRHKQAIPDNDTVEMNISFNGIGSKRLEPGPTLSPEHSQQNKLDDVLFERPARIQDNDQDSGLKSNSASYQRNSSSISTFDFDDYADSMTKDEVASSIYSKRDDNSSRQLSPMPKLDRVDSSPIEKFDVHMDYVAATPKTAMLESTPKFQSESQGATAMVIPNLNADSNGNVSNAFSSMYHENKDSDFQIPIRSPKRTPLSPVKNTTQFRTPELATPEKKISPADLLSPNNNHRKAHVLDDRAEETEKEPESFINLDETEEESLMSKDSVFCMEEHLATKLLSPIKYSVNSFDPQAQNSGLNIQGLDAEISSYSNNSSLMTRKATDHTPTSDLVNTPEQPFQTRFESTESTPVVKRKPTGGLGRSLTKVFGRGKHSNESKDRQLNEPPTPETITSRNSATISTINTPKRHGRTQSDHSFVAFTTPPLPNPSSNRHSRSISDSNAFESTERIPTADVQLQQLKSEINSLTLTKATILKDVQNLKHQLKILEIDVYEKQRTLRDLDTAIKNKQTLSSTDNLSISNRSANSNKNSSAEDFTGNLSTSENTTTDEIYTKQQPPIPPSQTNSTSPQLLPAANSTFNVHHQPASSSSNQFKDKRTGFMRRIFGAHSATGNMQAPANGTSGNLTGKTPTGSTISQPMNLRYNDDSLNYRDNTKSTPSETLSAPLGMKTSRSANFMQWRNNGTGNNTSKSSAITNSSENLLYTMTLQELADSEDGNGIPFILQTCITEVERRGLRLEGIYRISASTSTVEKLEQFFETLDVHNANDISKMRSLVDDGDIHALAGLLKRYLKKIPDSIIPQEFYDSYVNLANVSEHDRVSELSVLISHLPRANRVTLYALAKHLSLIADNEKWNKMNCASLSTVFAPTLARHNTLHPQQEIQDTKAKTVVTELLLKNYTTVFE